MNNTEITESISPTEFTVIPVTTSSALIPGKTIPVQVLTKTIRSNCDVHFEPNTSENSTS